MLKKLIALCVTVCVLFAPMASDASAVAGVSTSEVAVQMADCHPGSLHDTVQSGAQAVSETPQADTHHVHACCASLIAIVANWHLSHAAASSAMPIGPLPSLGFGVRLDGLFRPPRQIS